MGYLACGDTGAGKMPEPEDLLLDYILREVAFEKDLAGLKRVLVTAGPTRKQSIRFVILPITLQEKWDMLLPENVPSTRC